MDANAVKAIGELAVAAASANRILSDVPAIILEGAGGQQTITSIEHLQSLRSRFRGKFTTANMTDFVLYVTSHDNLPDIPSESAQGFVDVKTNSAVVFLNLGTPTAPGHADWRAELKLDPLAAYAAVCKVDGVTLAQDKLIEWLEDWSECLKAKFEDNQQPSHVTKAIAAFRALTVSSKAEATSTQATHGATLSAMEAVEASTKGGKPLPTRLFFSTSPFLDFKERAIELRVAIITTGEKPAVCLRIIGREALNEDIGEEFVAKLKTGIGQSAKIRAGAFTP